MKKLLMMALATIQMGCASGPGTSPPGAPPLPESQPIPEIWVSNVYSNECACVPSRGKTDRCSLTALLESGESVLDKRTAYFQLKRPDAAHLEIIGYAPEAEAFKSTSHLKAKLHRTVSGLDVALSNRPGLGVGMVAAIPIVGVGVKSATLRLAVVDDETLMGFLKYSEKGIALPLIPIHEDYLVKFTCKKAMTALPPPLREPMTP